MMVLFCFQDNVYLPGDPLEEDHELEFDKSAYDLYHEVNHFKEYSAALSDN